MKVNQLYFRRTKHLKKKIYTAEINFDYSKSRTKHILGVCFGKALKS